MITQCCLEEIAISAILTRSLESYDVINATMLGPSTLFRIDESKHVSRQVPPTGQVMVPQGNITDTSPPLCGRKRDQ